MKPSTVICTAEDIPRILADAARGDVAAEDPRDTGMTGGYPSIREAAPGDLPRLLYQNVGLYRTIVDKPAQDIWDQGWILNIDGQNPRLVSDVERVDREARIKQAFKRASIWARRDGRAFVILRLRDSTGDPKEAPMGVRSVLQARPIPNHRITQIRHATEGDRAGEPEAYEVEIKDRATGKKTLRWYHWQRVIPVVQHPDEDDDEQGVSVLSWNLRDSQGFENIKWGAAESYYRYGAPLYAVHIDGEADFDPKVDGPVLEEKLAKLRNNIEQKAWFKGAKIEVVTGSSSINPPDAYAGMFMDALAGGAQIPKRELTGSEAGALASAGWDEKRYFSRIMNDREDFAEPLVRTWYRRLDEWGIHPGLAQQLLDITWPPHLEPTEGEVSQVMTRVGIALQAFAKLGLPAPVQTWSILDWPDSLTAEEREAPLALVGTGSPFGLGGNAADEAKPRRQRNLAIEFSEALVKVEDRFQKRLLATLREWWNQVEDALEAAGFDDKRRRRRDQGPEAVTVVEFDAKPLQDLVEAVMRDAMALGASEMWNRLDRTEDIFDIIDTETWPRFAQFARDWGKDKARAATIRVREVIAEGISEGTGLRGIRRSLRDKFGELENETVIARTEAVRAYNGGAMEGMSHAGVLTWEWVAFAGMCPTCEALNGQTFPVGDAGLLPPEQSHPACRCQAAAIVD